MFANHARRYRLLRLQPGDPERSGATATAGCAQQRRCRAVEPLAVMKVIQSRPGEQDPAALARCNVERSYLPQGSA